MSWGILQLSDFPALEVLHVRNWDFFWPKDVSTPERACKEMLSAPKLKRLIWSLV
jgi:hypothetical protein